MTIAEEIRAAAAAMLHRVRAAEGPSEVFQDAWSELMTSLADQVAALEGQPVPPAARLTATDLPRGVVQLTRRA